MVYLTRKPHHFYFHGLCNDRSRCTQLHPQLHRRRRRASQGSTSTALLLSMDQPEEEEEEEATEVYNRTISSTEKQEMTSSSFAASSPPHSSASKAADETLRVNGAEYKPAPNVRNSLGPLLRLTRPENFPGIVLFHMLGSYLSLPSSSSGANYYWGTLLQQPAMWITLASLILTSSTSMVVNDYYDAKLGRDRYKHKALVDGDIPLYVARRFLNYLYALALVCVAFLPGIPTRLSVIVGLMLTYYYTQHLKPITWLKNIVCASLIALSPLTSGSAALHLHLAQLQSANHYHKYYSYWTSLQVLRVGPLWRLVSTLFFGILGREIMMDCNDYENDQQAGIRTVPIVQGRRFASWVAFLSNVSMAFSAMSGPLIHLLRLEQQQQLLSNLLVGQGGVAWSFESARTAFATVAVPVRRLALASVGSAIMLRRGWQVYRSEGANKELIDCAVNESLVTVLFVLASFI